MVGVAECPVCHGRDLVPYSFDAWSAADLHFAQVRCAGCGLLISQPQATAAEMAALYRHSYYDEHWPDAEGIFRETSALNERHEFALLQQLWASWPPPAGGSIVDVGCGYGAMFPALVAAGYQVTGCEPSARAVNFCRQQGFEVLEGVVPDVDFGRRFDVTVSLQVIEHVADIRSFVRTRSEEHTSELQSH